MPDSNSARSAVRIDDALSLHLVNHAGKPRWAGQAFGLNPGDGRYAPSMAFGHTL